MAVPKYHEFYNVFLESLNDGKIHSVKDCRNYIKQQMNFTDEELSETIPSGQPTWINRVGWCKTHLKVAGLLICPSRGHCQITDIGKNILAENIKITDTILIERFPAFAEAKRKRPSENIESTVINEETPQELFESSYNYITDKLSEELLESIMGGSPKFFESLVIKLMEAMGYGAGELTPSARDGGIDGIIYGDKLKFDRIGIQAKHYKKDSSIHSPAIHQFIGALKSQSFEKGIFITSSKFSKGAIREAEKNHIILVDGDKLAKLMIEFDVGVQTQKIYKIKRVDNDFFSED